MRKQVHIDQTVENGCVYVFDDLIWPKSHEHEDATFVIRTDQNFKGHDTSFGQSYLYKGLLRSQFILSNKLIIRCQPQALSYSATNGEKMVTHLPHRQDTKTRRSTNMSS